MCEEGEVLFDDDGGGGGEDDEDEDDDEDPIYLTEPCVVVAVRTMARNTVVGTGRQIATGSKWKGLTVDQVVGTA